MSRYQKGKTNLDFTEARDSVWQWHQLGHMQVCTSLQTDNHASTPPLKSFLQAGCPSCRPTNSVKALKANHSHNSIKPFKIYPSNRLHYDIAPCQSSDKRFKMQHCRHSLADISSCSFNLVAVIARSPTMKITMSSNSGILTQHFLISL